MLRHRLAALFEPRSVLVISARELPVVRQTPPRLRGRITEVRVDASGGVRLPERLDYLQEGQRPDLALLCVDPAHLPSILGALRRFRPRALVLLPHETPSRDPVETRVYCQSWGLMNDCLVLGPGALGVQRPHLGLNLSLEPDTAPVGRVAMVAQSRMVPAAVLDWAGDIRLGFSAVVSAGDETGVAVAEILEYLAMDPRTDSVVLYLEDVDSSRRFTSALNAAASVKPVIVLKVGRQADPAGASLAGDAVFSALLRRTGAVRIQFFVQLFSALKVLVHGPRHRGRRIAIVSNGHGAAHLALDVIGVGAPVTRAELGGQTRKDLAELLEPGAAVGNPVISHAPLDPERMRRMLSLLVADTAVDGVLVLLAPDRLSDMAPAIDALADFSAHAQKPIMCCFMGDASMRPLRHRLDLVGLPAFRTPESAANAFGILASYQYNQTLAQQALPPEMLNRPPRLDEARALLADARMTGRTHLDAHACRWLFDCFDMPVLFADRPLDPAIRAGLPMAVHIRQDLRFGPYIQFGPGGRLAEIANPNREIELPPLNNYLARQLIQRGKFWSRALSRTLSPAVFERLRETLERVSEIASELPGIRRLSIDPLWADDTALYAEAVEVELDVHDDGERPENRAYRHMAIHPYPRRLVRAMQFDDGQEWLLRPIRPEDAALLQEFVRDLSDESRYMRFVSMLRELTPRMLARYTRIDYDRELALVATIQVSNPENRGLLRERIIGFSHYLRNADGQGAEYALVVADDWQRRGLGQELMRGLIRAARRQGLGYIDGVILATNRPMLGLMAHLGFRNDPDEDDPGMRRVWLDLKASDAGG
ncbi:bifunctional acetate--CoA ligase family protein/GNAT family N-acetyltransferase [Castellaniella sp. S9]|uniref:bifunctional acetate--CoA ligase family protein/GNAT family N-acetyltransferase n=1 Tax=Castellaniella sp. S9 TaxID=2993652 RepID=UPI0022B31D9E|nr:GNAT family N-acetyltransferase [Castellaniella sp. S9]